MSKILDEKYYGPEPLLSVNSTRNEISDYFNWQNYFHTNDDAKEFFISHLKKIKFPKAKIKAFSKLDPFKHNIRTLGWYSRTLNLGGALPPELEQDYKNKLDKLNKEIEEDNSDDEPEEKFVVSIQERIENKVSDIIATLDDYVDDFACDGKCNLNVEEYFRNNSIKPVVAKRISDYYKPLYSEIYDALEGTDEQIKEAYDSWNRKKLTAYMNFVKSIIATADIHSIQTKIERKPRKKKEKPAALVVKKLKYKEKDEEYGLVSVNPATIIGANQCWVFNTKSRTLSVYNALGPAGLSVRGTTISGYDEKISISKRLRKPEKVLPKVLEGGKLVLRKLMDELTTTPKEANGRINADTILLKTIK